MGICTSIKNNSKNEADIENKYINLSSPLASYKKGEYFFTHRVEGPGVKEQKDEISLEKKTEIFPLLMNIKTKKEYQLRFYLNNNKKLNVFDFIGKTSYMSGHNIDYNESIIVKYFFEKEQHLQVKVQDKEGNEVSRASTILRKIFAKNGIILELPMLKEDGQEDNEVTFGILKLEMKSNEINTKSWFNIDLECNDKKYNAKECFFIINHFKDEKTFKKAYKTKEFIIKNNQVVHCAFKFDTELIFSGQNPKEKIQFQLYYWDNNNIEFIGELESDMNILRTSQNDKKESIIIKNNKDIAKFTINYKETPIKSFEEYLKEGLEINLAIGIDFSDSNLNPKNPNSLHYINDKYMNDYEMSIKSCGKIVGLYDKDQKFPVFGFGGIPNKNEKQRDCFNLNFHSNPNIESIENVIKKYRESLNKVKLSGPTNFAPLIKTVLNNMIKENRDDLYTILMILTDGGIEDFQETKNTIVDASKHPLSIIIIGLGKNRGFNEMIELDGDEKAVKNDKGEKWMRDIVQFVPYEKYKEKYKKNLRKFDNEEELKELFSSSLAEEVLKEIPKQIKEYFEYFEDKKNGRK